MQQQVRARMMPIPLRVLLAAQPESDLPGFVKDEFEAFLECGILAHGFLRVRCAECAHEKLVAFSCKRRGFCPSCGAQRMAESAAHLVDEVIPRVPVRQWVLSFPIPLRILFAAQPELLTPVLRIVHRVIAGFLLRQAGLKRATADTGAVTLIQRFGSAANLNIHLHCLVLDGVYRRTEGEPVFQQARAPTRDELQELLDKIIARLLRTLTRKGDLVEEQGMTYMADMDTDNPLASLQAASCTYRIALAAARRPEGAESAHRARPGRQSPLGPVRPGARVQPACRGALRRASAKATRTPVPLHHASGDRQRAARARWRG